MGAEQTRLEQQERERADALAAILGSDAAKKLIVAGPGAGKTHTFREALLACGGLGLALTFIRNLVADLQDALGDIADVFTFHGFCKHQIHRHPVAGLQEGWDYYPPLLDLITVDLQLIGRPSMTKKRIEDRLHDLNEADGVIVAALELGNYYNAVSHTDLVYRALKHFEENDDEIPEYPLIVVDEYQDFSKLETTFIALLSTKSPVLIAGDDDQALYGFKNASPEFIRELAGGDEFERFELPYCSRCSSVIVDAVNDAIAAAVENGNLVDRLDKPFRCYLPDKQPDSDAHPSIIHAKCTVERNSAPYVGRYVAEQIAQIPVEDIRESKEKGYPTVLVIGPSPFIGRAYDVIVEQFPHAKMKKAAQVNIEFLDAYRRLARDANSRLGWRILIHLDPFDDADDALRDVLAAGDEIVTILPDAYRDHHLEIAELLRRLFDDEQLGDADEGRLTGAVGKSVAEIREALNLADEDDDLDDDGDDEVDEDTPTIICTSLVGAKGLSAGYVFVVGFNNGHFPRDAREITDEEVCSFLVALSRTRKECHLVSCGRLGNVPLRVSAFAEWIEDEIEQVTVNAAYFNQR
jgi:superfamily I DNA/RNA helicase